jgi:hypothetical protein
MLFVTAQRIALLVPLAEILGVAPGYGKVVTGQNHGLSTYWWEDSNES